MTRRLLFLLIVVLALSGCGTINSINASHGSVQAFTTTDLQNAVIIAKAGNRDDHAQCFATLENHIGAQSVTAHVTGLFSAFEATQVGVPIDVQRDCATLMPNPRFLRLLLLLIGVNSGLP